MFGPLVLANKLKWTFFSLLLIFGLAFLALTVFCGLRYTKLKKSMNSVAPVEEGDALSNGGRDSIQGPREHTSLLTDHAAGQTGGNTEESDAAFDNDKPNVE